MQGTAIDNAGVSVDIARRYPWLGYLLFGVTACVLLAALMFRGASLLPVAAGFLLLVWFVQVPGSLLLLLYEGKVEGRLRFLLLGHAVGLAVLPLLHTLLYAVDLWRYYGEITSVLNLVLLAAVHRRGALGGLEVFRQRISPGTLAATGGLLLVAIFTVAVRQMIQVHPGSLTPVLDADVGYLMGVVAGIRDYGTAVNLHEGALPLAYHYFTYLVMAVVSRYSGAEALTISQGIFPPYLMTILALAAYHLTRTIGGSAKAGFVAGVFLFLLEDFSVLNQAMAVLFGIPSRNYFYTITSASNLQVSPSWVMATTLVLILMAEVGRLQRQTLTLVRFLPLILIAAVLPGYKVFNWAMFLAGLGLVSLLTIRRSRVLFYACMIIGVAGLLVLQLFNSAQQAEGLFQNVLFAYPLLRNDFVSPLLGLSGGKLLYSQIQAEHLLVIAAVVPFWFLLNFGIRAGWIVSTARRFGSLLREGDLLQSATLISIGMGILISLLMAPSRYSQTVTYLLLYGVLVSTPFAALFLLARMSGWRPLARLLVAGIVLVQIASGFIVSYRPLLVSKPYPKLERSWYNAMEYLRTQTAPDSRIVSNQFHIVPQKSAADALYSERFYWVAGFAERPVVTSGRYYYQVADTGYEQRRRQVDSLYAAADPAVASRIARDLDADYIIEGSLDGAPLSSRDSSFVIPVFSEGTMRVYRVVRQ